MNSSLLLAYASALSPIGPLLFFLKVRQPIRELQLVKVILITSLCFDIIAFASIFYRYNTYPLANVYFLIQGTILILIYKDQNIMNQKLSWTIMVAHALIFIGNFLFVQGPYMLNSYSVGISGLILMMMSLWYFYKLLVDLPEYYIHQVPMVWINIAVLVYYAGNLFLFLLNNYFMIEGSQRTMWVVHNTLNLTKNFLFMVAVWQAARKT